MADPEQTDIGGEPRLRFRDDVPHDEPAVTLDAFLDEVIGLLSQDPTPHEIVVERARPLRWSERDGTHAEMLAQRSQALSMLPGR